MPAVPATGGRGWRLKQNRESLDFISLRLSYKNIKHFIFMYMMLSMLYWGN